MKKEELNENELKVLQVLHDDTDSWGERSIGFDWIMEETKLTRKEVQKTCKLLRDKELVHFYRGLMTEEGQVVGSGYCISVRGQAVINPCDKCEDHAIYDWWEDSTGMMVFHDTKEAKHIKLCEKHYKNKDND